MYIHYYLDKSLKVAKVSGSLKKIQTPPKLAIGYTVEESDSELAFQLNELIQSQNISSAQFPHETPIYNLGFFEQNRNGRVSYFKLLQLSGDHEDGIIYVLEFSTTPDIFTIEKIDQDVIDDIEITRFKEII